jgi:DNA-binding XRE family transcriptional regulator
MTRRCTDPSNNRYQYYGARGITVCDRWRGVCGFENFLADMGERPPGMTLDRFPDINGNYEPGNCRWATKVQQARNKSTAKLESHEPAQIRWMINELGYKQSEVARFFGVSQQMVYRIVKNTAWRDG